MSDMTRASTSPASPPTSSVITAIEKQLRDVWVAEPGQPTKSRVCTMNLVVVASSKVIAERYLTIVDDVTSTTPARAIVVTLDADAVHGSLEGDVTAVCGIGEDATCSERVRLMASGPVCSRVASAVEALLVPEIPTSLVWLGRVHVEDPVFHAIAVQAQRVVLDTEYTSLTSLLQLARWARAEPDRPGVMDLAWIRLAPWLEMCARFFDEPKLGAHAMRIAKLTIRQHSDPGARLGTEGALLLGWFATRLGWKLDRLGGRLRYRRPDGGVVAVLLGCLPLPKTDVAPSALASVHVEAEVNGVTVHGSVDRDLQTPDMLVWKLDVDMPSATEQRVRLGANKGALLLERALHRPTSDPALMESVAFAEQIDDEGIFCT